MVTKRQFFCFSSNVSKQGSARETTENVTTVLHCPLSFIIDSILNQSESRLLTHSLRTREVPGCSLVNSLLRRNAWRSCQGKRREGIFQWPPVALQHAKVRIIHYILTILAKCVCRLLFIGNEHCPWDIFNSDMCF